MAVVTELTHELKFCQRILQTLYNFSSILQGWILQFQSGEHCDMLWLLLKLNSLSISEYCLTKAVIYSTTTTTSTTQLDVSVPPGGLHPFLCFILT